MTQTNFENELKEIKQLLTEQGEKPLSMSEACAYLHYSKSYLYKLTCKKQIPYYKPNGKMIFFKKSDLDAWLFRFRQLTEQELDEEANRHIEVKGKVNGQTDK